MLLAQRMAELCEQHGVRPEDLDLGRWESFCPGAEDVAPALPDPQQPWAAVGVQPTMIVYAWDAVFCLRRS